MIHGLQRFLPQLNLCFLSEQVLNIQALFHLNSLYCTKPKASGTKREHNYKRSQFCKCDLLIDNKSGAFLVFEKCFYTKLNLPLILFMVSIQDLSVELE